MASNGHDTHCALQARRTNRTFAINQAVSSDKNDIVDDVIPWWHNCVYIGLIYYSIIASVLCHTWSACVLLIIVAVATRLKRPTGSVNKLLNWKTVCLKYEYHSYLLISFPTGTLLCDVPTTLCSGSAFWEQLIVVVVGLWWASAELWEIYWSAG